MLNQEKGVFAEKIAADYLMGKGYNILFRNWCCRWGELDLIAETQRNLIFVEVKYRQSSKYGEIHESLTYQKRKHLYRSINIFLKQSTLLGKYSQWQVDLICIKGKFGKYTIDHYKSLSLT